MPYVQHQGAKLYWDEEGEGEINGHGSYSCLRDILPPVAGMPCIVDILPSLNRRLEGPC